MDRVTIESRNHKYKNTFGGWVYLSDFDTNHNRNVSFSWADRIAADLRFDKECRNKVLGNKEK